MASDSEDDISVDIDIRGPHRLKTTAPLETCHRLQPAAGASMADKRARRPHSERMDFEDAPSPNWGTPPHHLHHRFSPHMGRDDQSLNPFRRNTSGLHLPPLSTMAPPQQRRFAGDGFDHRRPVSSTRQYDVIDLTSDDASGPPSASEPQSRAASAAPSRPAQPSRRGPPQRGPRFGRDIIIDIDAEDAVDDQGNQPPAPPESPEVQFVGVRRRTPPPLPIDVETYERERDIEFLRANAAERPEDWPPFRRRFEHMFPAIIAPRHFLNPPAAPPRNDGGDRAAPRRTGYRGFVRDPAPRIDLGMGMGIDMDYDAVGFDIGTGERPAPTPPTYKAPPPAPEGFTRTPGEEGALACPNCGEELCVGETELQKQVWIIKACGHVYCGQCTSARHTRKSIKGKEKAAALPAVHRPFKECVVEGCNRKTSSHKAMIQIFL